MLSLSLSPDRPLSLSSFEISLSLSPDRSLSLSSFGISLSLSCSLALSQSTSLSLSLSPDRPLSLLRSLSLAHSRSISLSLSRNENFHRKERCTPSLSLSCYFFFLLPFSTSRRHFSTMHKLYSALLHLLSSSLSCGHC